VVLGRVGLLPALLKRWQRWRGGLADGLEADGGVPRVLDQRYRPTCVERESLP
jgi:hypothetical protein